MANGGCLPWLGFGYATILTAVWSVPLRKTAKDRPQLRRLLALAAIYDGATRSEAGRIGGVTLQIVRDPVLRFNASGPVGLINRKAPGAVPILDDRHRLALAQRVEQGPTPDLHGVVRQRATDVANADNSDFNFRIVSVLMGRKPPGPRQAGPGGVRVDVSSAARGGC